MILCMFRRWSFGIVALASVADPGLAEVASQEKAYFSFHQKSPKGELLHFIFEVRNPRTIEEMRSELKKPASRRHVSGVIVPSRENYNSQWSFYLIPETVDLFEMQIEVCDANVTYVEAHLDEVGGSFLPRSFWCPWSSELETELPSLPK